MQWFSLNKAHAWTPVFFGPAGVVFAPITGAKQELKYSSNIEYIASFAALKYVFDSSIMLKNLALAARIQVHTAALAASRPSCNRYYILSHEMLEAVIGFRAFWSGDYATAAAHLSKGGYFIHPLDVAVTALKVLAQRAWDSNDYAAARMRAIEALILDRTDVVNIYNAAIADWQYKRATAANQLHVSDDITWQHLAMLVLSQQSKISQADHLIIDIITAMRQGVLVKKPEFILRQLEQP